MFRIWYSTEDLAKWLISNTILKDENVSISPISESDASRPSTFFRMPTHLKNILYLDSPDLIIEYDNKSVFSLEVSREAGTGHNAFQRFARIAASLENGVPAFYIYPEAGYVYRQNRNGWDRLNPLIFDAMEKAMRIYNVPALLYYFPSCFQSGKLDFSPATKGLLHDSINVTCPDSKSEEMQKMFGAINKIIEVYKKGSNKNEFLGELPIQQRRDWMINEFHIKQVESGISSPLTATELIKTEILLNHLKKTAGENHDFGDLLPKRDQTLIYKADAVFRGDPYPGALAALDYIKCRKGKSFEDRNYNLVMAWGNFSINENEEIVLEGDEGRSIERFMSTVRDTYNTPGKILLSRKFDQLQGNEIPRYFMQVRFGSSFTKVKHVRVYSYFCDAILFPDGSLWREG
jgi:hypothetical protein